jgi:hypothetical protein
MGMGMGMGIIGGRVVMTPTGQQPYKVVLEHDGDAGASEHPVSSMQEGEILIRQKSPPPLPVDDMREWNNRT